MQSNIAPHPLPSHLRQQTPTPPFTNEHQIAKQWNCSLQSSAATPVLHHAICCPIEAAAESCSQSPSFPSGSCGEAAGSCISHHSSSLRAAAQAEAAIDGQLDGVKALWKQRGRCREADYCTSMSQQLQHSSRENSGSFEPQPSQVGILMRQQAGKLITAHPRQSSSRTPRGTWSRGCRRWASSWSSARGPP